MVCINGEKSVGRVTRIHGDRNNGDEVLCVHVDIPRSEEEAWKIHESIGLEVDWTQDLTCPDLPWVEICRTRSVQGEFAIEVQRPVLEGCFLRYVPLHTR